MSSPSAPDGRAPREPPRDIPPSEATDVETLRAGEPVVFVDRKHRKYLAILADDMRFNLRGGFILGQDLVGTQPGALLFTSRREPVRAYRATLEEYILLMPRGATIIPPKDIGFMTQWGDIGPGATVVEAGIGSGAMSLGLLRAVGPSGRVISFDLRVDFLNLARKNIRNWSPALLERYDPRVGNVHEELAGLSNIDRVVLDLPDPWSALDGAARALRPGGFLVSYNPSMRQIDELVRAICRHREFRDPEVGEMIFRPWVADWVRLRPALRITGHTGFVLRARRRSPMEVATSRDDDPAMLGDLEDEAAGAGGPLAE